MNHDLERLLELVSLIRISLNEYNEMINLKSKLNKMSQKLDSIESYVRILQDGDPENENPKKILDYIDEIMERKI